MAQVEVEYTTSFARCFFVGCEICAFHNQITVSVDLDVEPGFILNYLFMEIFTVFSLPSVIGYNASFKHTWE